MRSEIRTWIAENLDPALRGSIHGDLTPERLVGLRDWNRRLADAGFAGMAWPREYGGRDAGVIEQVVFAEEMARAEAPGPLNPIGLANIAPAIMAFGSDEQQQRFLRPMLRGDEIWCQGFSEPGAGSDLASLRTSASLDGDHFVVSGQKIWTTFGRHADWCELLVRTDPDAPKHAGISCLLVDMSLPGVEARPLRTIAGTHEFSELFFEEVRVPRSALLGAVNQGWKVAVTTLSFERAGVASLHIGVRRKVAKLLAAARETQRDGGRAIDDANVRSEIARCYTLGEYMKALADRAIHAKTPGAEGSIAKLVWSDVEDRIAHASGEVLGVAANAGDKGRERISARSTSIAGGTTQVNKNIVAQRVLGFPRAH